MSFVSDKEGILECFVVVINFVVVHIFHFIMPLLLTIIHSDAASVGLVSHFWIGVVSTPKVCGVEGVWSALQTE